MFRVQSMIHILILILYIYIYIYLNPLPFRVSCKKCAAGVKQIDDTISDGGKHIPTYTIKRCDKTLLKRGCGLEFLWTT